MSISVLDVNVGDKVAFTTDIGSEVVGPYTVTDKNKLRITFTNDDTGHIRVVSARSGKERDYYSGKYRSFVRLASLNRINNRNQESILKQERLFKLWRELNSLSTIRTISSVIRMKEIIAQLEAEHYNIFDESFSS